MNAIDTDLLQVTVPIAGSIIVATLGWIFTYLHGKRAVSREAELNRVNDQLRLLYGPLYATLLAGDSAWQALSTSKYWPAHGRKGYFAEGFELSEKELTRWRTWMREVFTPNNQRLEQIILQHLDLLEGGKLPPVFVQTLAHIAVYRVVLKQWEGGDFSEYISVVDFPAAELISVVEPTYRALLKKQQRLISG